MHSLDFLTKKNSILLCRQQEYYTLFNQLLDGGYAVVLMLIGRRIGMIELAPVEINYALKPKQYNTS